ncbi:MAG TPA: hypothetical protein VM694_14510, partial [Polyangium sp.]|nr:hypothetical protein [Polyangium sp.]
PTIARPLCLLARAFPQAELRALVGSGDEALIATLVSEHDHALAEVDRLDAGAPSAAEAVAALVRGHMEDGESNFKYGYALELACRQLGQELSNQHWSRMHGEWFDAVEDAFTELGGKTKVSNDVFWSGPPVELPFIDDFPAIGTVPAEGVKPLLAELDAALAKARSSQENAALRELLAWLRIADRDALGIVTFYY